MIKNISTNQLHSWLVLFALQKVGSISRYVSVIIFRKIAHFKFCDVIIYSRKEFWRPLYEFENSNF